MALRQLVNRCAGAAKQLVSSQAVAASQETVQQQCGRQSAVFQQLTASMRHDLQRQYSQVFQPSRLYPKQHTTGEAYAFWGLIGINLAMTFASKTALPDVKQFVLTNFRTSIEAVSDGRLYTLLTSSVCHTSAVHCAINLLMLAIFRRTQPLTAKEVSNTSCYTCILPLLADSVAGSTPPHVPQAVTGSKQLPTQFHNQLTACC